MSSEQERGKSSGPDGEWDVIVVGGALTGSAMAIELLKRTPSLRVLIVESGIEHKRRVGESTVEVSSYFLARVLGFSGELNRNHISKQGLRFWFANDSVERFSDCSEVGPKFNVLFPGYQIDRARFDEAALDKAGSLGAVVLRPAKVKRVELNEGGTQRLQVEQDGATRAFSCRWVVDASGARGLIARSRGWMRPNEAHPIAALWSRWRGVTDWDDESLYAESPRWADSVYGVRNNATNHLLGKGWWAWWIPLQNGDVSIGVVYDQRIFELPAGASLGERLAAHLRGHPMGERLLRGAEFIEGDVTFKRNLAYVSERFAGDGFVLAGDAAGFIDPFYSPGLDWLCYGVMAGAKLIGDSFESGAACPKAIETHNRQFRDSYQRWFDSIYRDKYFYMGDFELMGLAFRLDLAFYYLGAVSRPFLLGRDSLAVPSFGQPEGKWPAKLISFYNRRFAAMGRKRMANGRWGRRNARCRAPFFSYRLNWTLGLRLVAVGFAYLWLELRELLANAVAPSKAQEAPAPVPEGVPGSDR